MISVVGLLGGVSLGTLLLKKPQTTQRWHQLVHFLSDHFLCAAVVHGYSPPQSLTATVIQMMSSSTTLLLADFVLSVHLCGRCVRLVGRHVLISALVMSLHDGLRAAEVPGASEVHLECRCFHEGRRSQQGRLVA